MDIDDTFFRHLVDNMNEGVYVVNRARQIEYWSRGAERLTGFQGCDVVGKRCRDNILNHVDDQGVELCTHRCPLHATMRDGAPREIRVWMKHADGHRHPVWVRSAPLRDAEGNIVGAVELFADDSAVVQAKERVAELEPLALTDSLTGLGNRRFLETQLTARIDEWNRYGWPFGLLMADIDHFKAINDTFGHDIGDDALAMVARTLAFGLRGSDVAARFGGEEFVVVLPHTQLEGIHTTGERLRGLVEASRLVAHRQRVELTVSIGGTIVTPGDSAETILRRVDDMLYRAKDAGRNRVVVEGWDG